MHISNTVHFHNSTMKLSLTEFCNMATYLLSNNTNEKYFFAIKNRKQSHKKCIILLTKQIIFELPSRLFIHSISLSFI